MADYLVLAVAAFVAGMIDVVVGGGGLIQLPALFSALPNVVPATLLGTSKLAGVWGTAAAAAFALSFVGAYTVTHIPPDFIRKFLPFLLVAVAAYTYKKKDFGSINAPLYAGGKERACAILVGGGIGFYDGFFGPGTGSILVFLFVRFFGFDFLGASAVAKVVNVACNVAALLWFGYSGHLLWQLGALMAICNVLGSLLGIRLALLYGSGFVRKLFLLVVSGLILKTAYDAYLA